MNNTDDYLFSVGDVVIWGYAENGVGFIVGCISTLRPLFRKIFHLGGSENSNGKLGDSERGSLPLTRGRGRQTSYGDPFCIGDVTQGKTQTAGESEEYILQDMRGNDARNAHKEMNDLGGIQVSRSVHQRRD